MIVCFSRGVLDTTLCDKGRWFSPGTLVSSTNKTDRHDTTEILLKVGLGTINHKPTNKKNNLKMDEKSRNKINVDETTKHFNSFILEMN